MFLLLFLSCLVLTLFQFIFLLLYPELFFFFSASCSGSCPFSSLRFLFPFLFLPLAYTVTARETASNFQVYSTYLQYAYLQNCAVKSLPRIFHISGPLRAICWRLPLSFPKSNREVIAPEVISGKGIFCNRCGGNLQISLRPNSDWQREEFFSI